YYIFLKLIKSSKKSSYSLANLRKVIKEADIPVNKIILHFIYIVAVAVLIGVFSYVHYLNNQYRNRLSRNFHITSINPSNASQARKVNLKGYHFGIKSDDAYKVNSDQGYITEIKKWDEDNVEFIVPLTTDPGKLKIWIERPVDELHREQGTIVSNPVVLGVYSRFLIYPETTDTLTDRVIKKIKNFSFYNLNMFNSFFFKTYK
ncbi:MAG: hypothetical protein Q8P72_02835, partial [Candidatus Roizmanbacteria bacterium]|nr:hypothetical protein [Candidatus Roizmanbacteria bacterium]